MTSEKIGGLVKALIKAKSKFKPVIKDKENPFYHSMYATLDSIIEATEHALHENGLDVIQTTGVEGDKFGLITTLAHESGEFISGFYHLNPAKANDPQAYGSCVSYARRYSLAAILGISPESDDDGNVASGKPAAPAAVAANAPAQSGIKVSFVPADVTEKTGEKNGKPWTSYGIKSPSGDWYSTFNEKFAELARTAKDGGTEIDLEFALNGKFRNATKVVAGAPF